MTDFSWVVSGRNTFLVHNKDSPSPPSNSLRVVYPLGADNGPLSPIYHFIIARTRLGTIPGFFNGKQGFYAYAGKERATDDFDWVVIEEEKKDDVVIEEEKKEDVIIEEEKKEDVVMTEAEPEIEQRIGISMFIFKYLRSYNQTLNQPF